MSFRSFIDKVIRYIFIPDKMTMTAIVAGIQALKGKEPVFHLEHFMQVSLKSL
jgi:hypothetical protein